MGNPGLTQEQMQEALTAYERNGNSQTAAAQELGLNRSTFKNRLVQARKAQFITPEMGDKCRDFGISPEHLRGGWFKDKEASLRFSIPDEEHVSFEEMFSGALADKKADMPISFPPKPITSGENLLVVDLADVHVGKLCVGSETGFEYSREIARHRVIEGTKGLLEKSSVHGVKHVLFVTGNDILHVDDPRGHTTSGTPQDTHGTLDQMYSDAKACLIESIDLCAQLAPVDVLHCPSNHDWQNGWALAQTVQAWYRNSKSVNVTDYNVSKIHRKYFRFGGNLIGASHGDGAKEAELAQLMLVEAREHIAECEFTYWYLHHFHHNIRKGGMNKIQRLKEYTAMTVINSGAGRIAGDGPEIEYVHSPSAPDGWHHRNGYINRQGVDCFLHSPEMGRFASFTEWF